MGEHVSPDTEIAPLRLVGIEARMPADVGERIVRESLRRLERRRRRRQVLWIGAPMAVAAAAALVVWLARASGPEPGIAAPGNGLAPAPVAVHASGADAVEVALGAHQVHLAPESRVEVIRAPGADVDLALARGSAEFSVAPLVAGHGFRVATDTVLVEVVGTRFSVSLTDGCTAVAVTEGVVRVTPASGDTAELRAGGQQRFCPATAEESAVAGERWVREALVLVSENRDAARAMILLERYLAHHERGVFAEDAMFHLSLLYRQQGRGEDAARLAGHFVERFPGTRRAERLRSEILTAD
jgi:transmembrane sensor